MCDVPASTCTEWASHCKATHASAHWREQRQYKKAGGSNAGGSGGASSSSSRGGGSASVGDYRQNLARFSRLSCDQLLKSIEQVYPVEHAEPAGFAPSLKLRPYQKQSLAFMVHVEQNGYPGHDNSNATECTDGSYSASSSAASSAASSSSVGGGKMAVASGPVVHSLPNADPTLRAGWLCDEVGMGKTAICASLILANPSTTPPVSDARFARLTDPYDPAVHPIPLKLTLIIVNNTLVRQWADEMKKFAPSLKVHVFYSDAGQKRAALSELREADALITTPHMVLPHGLAEKIVCSPTTEARLSNPGRVRPMRPTSPPELWTRVPCRAPCAPCAPLSPGVPRSRALACAQRVHRLIMDEAHLLAKGSTTHSKLSALKGYHAERKWLVTGTPFSTSLEQLACQAELLGHTMRGIHVHEFTKGIVRPNWTAPPVPDYVRNNPRLMKHYRRNHRDTPPHDRMSNEAVIDRLRSVMIRHTKSQRIGGTVALALPDADLQTVWLSMSADERLLYELHHCCEPNFNLAAAKKLDACSHLYDLKIVLGADGSRCFTDAMKAVVRRQMLDEGIDDPDGSSMRASEDGTYAEIRQKEEAFADRVRKTFPEPSLDAPRAFGALPEAAAAFKRLHEEISVKFVKPTIKQQRLIDSGDAEPPPTKTWRSLASLTKFRTLMEDLHALRADEPSARFVVFTRHDAVQERLVTLITSEVRTGGLLETPQGHKPLKVFEFNKHTPPTKRHRLIQDFQDGQDSGGARVFIVTYATAAVGITLTAANRVFLMEPCPDPGQEAQAAGRIHRLGQTKDVFIKRYAFKDSIEETIIRLHEKIKAGEVKIVDGRMPHNADRILSEAGKSMAAHSFTGSLQPCEASGFDNPSHHYGQMSAFQLEWPQNWGGPYKAANTWTRAYQIQECVHCGECREVRGSSTYKGTGIFSYLNDCTRDPPCSAAFTEADAHFRMSGHGRFGRVPRPPKGWRGLPECELSNGERLPKDGSWTFGEVTPPDLSHLREAVKQYFATVEKERKRKEESMGHAYMRATGDPADLGWHPARAVKKAVGVCSRTDGHLSEEVLVYTELVLDELCEVGDGSQPNGGYASYGMYRLKPASSSSAAAATAAAAAGSASASGSSA